MPTVTANGLELYYETQGEGPPLVLIMGLGAQMVMWDDELCDMLADRGFRLIRFDNRDVGLSTKLEHLGKPRLRRTLLRGALGMSVRAPYTLSDMAADVAGLLDALDIDAAHVVGASMGGMIAQTLAIEHPARVRSLVSIMSHPGNRASTLSKPSALRALTRPVSRERQAVIAHYEAMFRAIGSPGYAFDAERVRARAARSYDRCFSPAGFLRQFAAVCAARDRRRALRRVHVPALVIHGDSDPLIPPRGGKATAAALPDAALRLVPGMGHDLPRALWPRFADEIAALARRADERRASRRAG